MRVRRIDDPASFLELVAPLLDNEANNSVVIGTTRHLIRTPDALDATFHVVENGGVAAGVVVFRNEAALVTDLADADAISPTARILAGLPDLEFFNANDPHAAGIAAAVAAATGAELEMVMAMGAFTLRTVTRLPAPTGAAREARAEDRELLIDWAMTFSAEALPQEPAHRERISELIDGRLDPTTTSGIMMWEVDGTPVAMSGYSGDTGTGIRVNLVFTPPEHRGQGYATGLCTAQAEALLARGYTQIHLFTDLANPTSNAIYQRIGYERAGTSRRYRVLRPES